MPYNNQQCANTQTLICPIRRDVDVYLAVGQGREISAQVGLNDIDRTRVEIVILELARNILAHATSGQISIECIEHAGQRGVVVLAQDSGPGIPDTELALRDGYSTKQTLGAGLPGVRRLMEEFTITSVVGVGTTVRTVKWLKLPRAAAYRNKV